MRKKFATISFLTAFLAVSYTIKAQSSILANDHIISFLEKKREYNKYNGFGYRIQLYNGNEKSARNYRYSFQKEFPGVYTRLRYKSPEWKTQVGAYKTRLDADRALNKIREKFSGAIVIPM